LKDVASKAKLKATKTLAKKAVAAKKAPAPAKKAPESAKKAPESAKTATEPVAPEEKPEPKEKSEEKEDVAPKEEEPKDKKRKAEKTPTAEAPERKRRMITPNKKFEDFEVDAPSSSKRTITPNKRYADYETEMPSSSKKVSELRAFIIDKKGKPEEAKDKETPKAKAKAASPKKAAPKVKVEEEKEDSESESDSEDKPKVFKESEMKPAEKLMKKLQKKLEKEAKAVGVSSPPDNREKAKIKITKVVEYSKTVTKDDAEMKKLAKKVAGTPKPKATPTPKQATAATAAQASDAGKTPKAKATPKPGAKPGAAKPQVEKVVKPKKMKELKREERPIQAQFLCQKTIKLNSDNKEGKCWITGIGVFPSGEIILVDMANKKIKLFSAEFAYLSQCQLDTIPQDISVSPVDASCAYFTKPFSKEGIQKVVMSDGKLTLKEFFTTNGTNRGIACMKTGILTSVQDGRYHDVDINHFKIYLLDYAGNILQSVSTDSNGSRLFKLPLYFTVSNSGKQIIVSDCIKQNSYVVSVDMSGKIYFKYEGNGGELITPRGLTIDDEDNIYITEWERNTVYMLNPAGKRIQTLFNHKELLADKLDGMTKPYQLCFYKTETTKKLIVSQESCDTVKVFRILKKEEAEAEAKAKAEELEAKKPVENGETPVTTPAAAPTVPAPAPTAAAKIETAAPAVEMIEVKTDQPKSVQVQTKKPAVTVREMAKKPSILAKAVEVKTTAAGTPVKTVIIRKPDVGSVAAAVSAVKAESPIKPKVIQIRQPVTTAAQQKKVEVFVATKAGVGGATPTVQVLAKKPTSTPIVVNTGMTQTRVQKVISSPRVVTIGFPKEQATVVTQASVVTQSPPQQKREPSPEEKKEEIFANTVDDFNDEAENVDADMNGKLQDLVDAFATESEVVETVVSQSQQQEQMETEMAAQMTQVPAQITEEQVVVTHSFVSEPQVTIIQASEPMGQESEQVTYIQTVTEEPMQTDELVTEMGDAHETIVQQTVEEVPAEVPAEMMTTVEEGEVPHGMENVVMDTELDHSGGVQYGVEQEIVETTVVSEAGIAQYQDVPVELENITTEFTV